MKKDNFHDADREQTSVLAPVERTILRALARRMPAWINSDHLSVLGLGAMLMVGVGYAASRQNPLMLHVVNLCIFLNWLSISRRRAFVITASPTSNSTWSVTASSGQTI